VLETALYKEPSSQIRTPDDAACLALKASGPTRRAVPLQKSREPLLQPSSQIPNGKFQQSYASAKMWVIESRRTLRIEAQMVVAGGAPASDL
jgi:hypothetical protein